MNPRVFREYDIRGVADRDLDDRMVHALGMAIGAKVPKQTVVVGRDCRLTSPRLFATLTDGIRVHAEVIDIGVVPTPVLYFASHHLKPAAAVMSVSATMIQSRAVTRGSRRLPSGTTWARSRGQPGGPDEANDLRRERAGKTPRAARRRVAGRRARTSA